MHRPVLVVAFCLLMAVSSAYALEVAGITMPETLSAGDASLALNGAGVRSKFGIKLYVCGLYLPEKSQDAPAIVAADSPMAARLHITSGLITGEKMEEAVRDGFDLSTGGNTAPIAAEIDQMLSIFRDNVSENDTYDLIYTPGSGVEAFKNNTSKCVIEGLAFKQALFGMWLGEKPVQKKLKEQMLGL